MEFDFFLSILFLIFFVFMCMAMSNTGLVLFLLFFFFFFFLYFPVWFVSQCYFNLIRIVERPSLLLVLRNDLCNIKVIYLLKVE